MRKLILVILTIIPVLAGLRGCAETETQRPNIIVLMTDDQAIFTMGCEGNRQVRTPHMDELAETGIRFRNHYATTSICMASRATMMTGMLEYKTGCNFLHGPLSKEKFSKSYPVLLQEAGYRTGFAGKLGFAVTDSDDWKDNAYGSFDVMPIDEFDSWAGGKGQTRYETANNKYIAHYAEEYPHSTLAYGAYGRDFIRESVKEGKPFCLSIYFKAPHGPLAPDPVFDGVYENTSFKKPENYGREKGAHLAKQARLGRQYLKYFNQFCEPGLFDQNTRLINQLIHGVDMAVGMITDELEKQGIADNTIIIFTSDNGFSVGSHGVGGKVLPYEETSRIPLIICDPRSSPWLQGTITHSLTGNVDIMPTVLDYAGIDIPENVDGKSLVPVVSDPEKRVRKSLPLIQAWGSHTTFAFTVLTDDWKYIYWYFADKMDPSEELFHVRNDPFEMNNLAGDPAHASQLKMMRKLYDAQVKKWREEAVPIANYPVYAKLYDRTVPWEEKKVLIPEVHRDYYQGVLKSIGYEGDPDDYGMIIDFVEEYNIWKEK